MNMEYDWVTVQCVTAQQGDEGQQGRLGKDKTKARPTRQSGLEASFKIKTISLVTTVKM